MYLKTRKQKVEDEKFKIMREDKGFVDSPRSTRVETLRSSEYRQSMNDYEAADNTMNRCDDDSFLAMEKICENTLHIANESEILMDLTSMDSPLTQRKSLKKLPTIVDESHLNDIEAPSFFNNSSMISPNKHSPLIEFNANRPSTIMEVSEMSNKTYQSSYRTAMTGTEASQYKTADGSLTLGNTLEEATSIRDDTNEVEEFIKIKMPKIRSFYNDASPNMTRDSLELTGKIHHTIDLTKDSLESSSGVELSYDNNEEEEGDGDKMNDTLEQIEYMLAQAQRIQDEKAAKIEPVTPKPINSKTPASAKRPQHKLATPAPGSASKYSPLIKFSPVVRNSPGDSAFKKPGPSATKNPPQPMYAHNKKFQHIVSPISRYIKHTPGLPFSTTARVLPGIGNNSPKQYNFRDSETFSNENDSMNRGEGAYKGSSLPFRAKTKSSAVTQVRFFMKFSNF